MIYRERNELNIMELEGNEENISFGKLEKAILSKPSNVLYCERNKKLCGIITMGDIVRACEAGRDFVAVNTRFTRLQDVGYMKARNIFRDRESINALPIIDKDGMLTGGWSRWNDLSDIENTFGGGQNYNIVSDAKVALMLPDDTIAGMRDAVHLYGEKLAEYGVDVREICYDEIMQYDGRVDSVLFASEDELRAFVTLYRYMHNGILDWTKWDTCKRWVNKNIALDVNEDMNIDTNFIEEHLQSMCRQGVRVLNLYFDYENEHFKRLDDDINKKYKNIDRERRSALIPEIDRDFFHDLYTEEYVKSFHSFHDFFRIGIKIENKIGYAVLKAFHNSFFNISNGERFTKGVPKEYTKTIYFIGPCFIFGYYVADDNTIESILQNRLNKEGYKIKVVNYGILGYTNSWIQTLARIKTIGLKKGDIIVEYCANIAFKNINNLDLSDLLKEVSAGWVVNSHFHCNHKVNALFTDAIYDALEPVLDETVPGHGERIGFDSDFIKSLYIDSYFHDFTPSMHEKIGAIVMNCNPFTYGHRYLIETVLNMVDFLIIFVVEEDKSVFSFDERYAMVRGGTADLKNVMPVPSGPFILSQATFPEYFIKAADEDLVENVENDITIFAEKIAPHLNIKYRFVGEEPEDAVTNEYNMAMKRILPKYGIELVEIPRKTQDGRYISASTVRRCLEDSDMAELRKLVPASTVEVLFGKLPGKHVFR